MMLVVLMLSHNVLVIDLLLFVVLITVVLVVLLHNSLNLNAVISILARRGSIDAISLNAGEGRVIGGTIILVLVGPLPFDSIPTLVAVIIEENALLAHVVCPVPTTELRSTCIEVDDTTV